MGKCKFSGGIKKIKIQYGRSINEIEDAEPNSKTEAYDELTDELLQERWYGPDGRVIKNRDWRHSDTKNTHEFPHDHDWTWIDGKAKRSKGKKPDWNIC